MRHYLVNIFLLSFYFYSPGLNCQNLKTDIYPITSNNWEKFDYAQIRFFEDILEKNNILVLSEQNHGDGAAYDAQCMILKGLIDSNKIKIIYTESSWINIEKINEELLNKGISAIRSTYKYMNSVELRYWVDNGFWDYLARKIINKEVYLRGFDIDGCSPLIASELFNEAIRLPLVEKYIFSNKEEFDNIKGDYEQEVFAGWGLQSTYYEKSYNYQNHFINQIIAAYTEINLANKVKQWNSILNFFYWMYKRSEVLKYNKYINVVEGNKQLSLFHSIRDSLLADIFMNYHKLNPNSKCVVLVASYHGIHNTNSIEGINECCKEPEINTMGEIINKKITSGIFNVCFIASGGERGLYDYFSPRHPLRLKLQKNSLEHTLKGSNCSYAFIDLTNSIYKDSSFYMNAIYGTYLKSNWSKNFSGILFIKKMYPLEFKNPSVLLSREELQKN